MDREESYSSVSNRIRVLQESRRYEEAEEEIRREMEKNPNHLFLRGIPLIMPSEALLKKAVRLRGI